MLLSQEFTAANETVLEQLERLKQRYTGKGCERYTQEQKASVRREILSVLPGGKGLPPREITDALYMHPAHVVERELRYLAGHTKSAVKWSGKRGQGSRYFRVR